MSQRPEDVRGHCEGGRDVRVQVLRQLVGESGFVFAAVSQAKCLPDETSPSGQPRRECCDPLLGKAWDVATEKARRHRAAISSALPASWAKSYSSVTRFRKERPAPCSCCAGAAGGGTGKVRQHSPRPQARQLSCPLSVCGSPSRDDRATQTKCGRPEKLCEGSEANPMYGDDRY